MNQAYGHHIQIIMNLHQKIGPIKECQVKQSFQEWFEGDITDEIKTRVKVFNRLKRIRATC